MIIVKPLPRAHAPFLFRPQVEPRSKTETSEDSGFGDGLAGALRRALEERNGALNPSDSETSDSDGGAGSDIDEDEWDD